MRKLAALILLSACAGGVPRGAAPVGREPDVGEARRFLDEAILFDGHNDLPWAIREAGGDLDRYDIRSTVEGHTDIARLRAGGVGAQFWSVYVPADEPEPMKVQLEQIDLARQLFARYPDVLTETLSSAEVEPVFRSGRIASVMGMEGGHVIENSLAALRMFYALGARYMTLTHSASTDWADAATADPRHDGLTEFGREVVREMNRLGMLVDLSHVSPATMHDALDVTEAPVIFSHSSARALVDVPWNVPDDVLRRVRENRGVVMVTFVPGFINRDVAAWEAMPRPRPAGLTQPRATLDDAVLHIEHVRRVAGVDHVGIGGDFDGIGTVPEGLEDVSDYPALFARLRERGWTDADLGKLAGGNVRRVWREAEGVAERLQARRGPSRATIE